MRCHAGAGAEGCRASLVQAQSPATQHTSDSLSTGLWFCLGNGGGRWAVKSVEPIDAQEEAAPRAVQARMEAALGALA